MAYETNHASLLARIREISDTVYIPGCSSEFSCSLLYHAMNLSLNRPLYAAAVKIASALGFEPEEIHTMSGSDANHINQYDIPVIDALGPYTYGIHTTDEHTVISSIRHQTLFAAALIQDLFLHYFGS
ncbi:MAG: M20/M25/M40 family metallo-hydrolase [Lachnospiraceae bacterium]|nr:M20/M25/M40 family metallo-hydrolase [Lachnospiraceae bacterium]